MESVEMPGLLRRGTTVARCGTTAAAAAAAAAALLALAVAGGCHGPYDEKLPPFDPRALQSNERDNAANTPEARTRPLPTTFRSEFPVDPNATRPTDLPPPTTGPAIGTTETIVRMPLREL